MFCAMNLRRPAILAVVLAVGASALLMVSAAADRPAENVMASKVPVAAAVFVVPTAFAFEKILPPLPPPGSGAALADQESVLQAQGWRTPEQVAWAKAVERDSGRRRASHLLPSWFCGERHWRHQTGWPRAAVGAHPSSVFR